jgi:hypothetical protein
MIEDKRFIVALEEFVSAYGVDKQLKSPNYVVADYIKRCLKSYNDTPLIRDTYIQAAKARTEEILRENGINEVYTDFE